MIEYARHNDEIAGYGFWRQATLAPRTICALDSYRDIQSLLQQQRPDVAHFHNTFPLISPAAYYACRAAGVPVVQTLHNFRLLCPGAELRRGNGVCEACLGKILPWPALLHACYRGNGAATATASAMLAVHNLLQTWARMVDVFIALTAGGRRKFIAGGLPAEKILVKPNFVDPDPGSSDGETVAPKESSPAPCALFAGRLSPEKGVRTLVAAWKRLGPTSPQSLRILGGGPLRRELESSVNGSKVIRFEGYLAKDQVLERLKSARFLVFPSEWYEGFPLIIAEAFACGVPVIASRLGAMAEIVEDGKTGLHFSPGDPEDLAEKVAWAWAHPREMSLLGRAARAEFETKYTAARNVELLLGAYRRALHAAEERSRTWAHASAF